MSPASWSKTSSSEVDIYLTQHLLVAGEFGRAGEVLAAKSWAIVNLFSDRCSATRYQVQGGRLKIQTTEQYRICHSELRDGERKLLDSAHASPPAAVSETPKVRGHLKTKRNLFFRND